MTPARIAVPEPTSTDAAYNERTWPQYARAIERCGGIAIPISLGETQAHVAEIISGCCGILLPGSPADLNPQKYNQAPGVETAPPDHLREAVDELLLQDAFNLHKPVLGICFGLQALNVWRNGTLLQHIGGSRHEQSERDAAHPIHIAPDSRIAAALGSRRVTLSDETWVNSSHHQAVQVPGDGMSISAVSPADGVIEALELVSETHFVVGVQWHPERTFDRELLSAGLFQLFVTAVGEWKLEPIQESVVGMGSV